MGFDKLMRFSSDLRQHAGVDNSLRRMGDELILRVGGSEFVFDSEGRYAGPGDARHQSLGDLVVDLERGAEVRSEATQ
jgi:hypothetical protein